MFSAGAFAATVPFAGVNGGESLRHASSPCRPHVVSDVGVVAVGIGDVRVLVGAEMLRLEPMLTCLTVQESAPMSASLSEWASRWELTSQSEWAQAGPARRTLRAQPPAPWQPVRQASASSPPPCGRGPAMDGMSLSSRSPAP